MFKIRDLRSKVDVTDLKLERPAYRISSHELRRYFITQVLDLIHHPALDRLAECYKIRTRHFGCR